MICIVITKQVLVFCALDVAIDGVNVFWFVVVVDEDEHDDDVT